MTLSLKLFRCRCGQKDCTAPKRPHPDLVEKLDELAERSRIPFFIISGNRCDEHNEAIGGIPTSQHLVGRAVKITTRTANEAAALAGMAEVIGFRDVGHKPGRRRLHLDVRRGRVARW